MENLLNKNDINIFLDLEFAKYNKQRKEELIRNFSTMPSDEPFSQRLNDWLVSWYNDQKDHVHFEFVTEDDFNPKDIKGTLNRYIERFEKERVIRIWTGSSDNSMFGNEAVNVLYRCFHDYVHITQKAGFDFAGESFTALVQASLIPSDWLLEKQLIMTDIVGLNLYHRAHNKEYVVDQRQFIIDFLKNPADAIFRKQIAK
ncbi:hypothetical protein [Chryseobacterium limigenitum]|uniref:Uncharacterized protein n=1 Tax=Chryseobacterium limigenitum TaxID=1612149 RepID=A0A1K2IH42_9FLAO|nr:hypothetical protein [Chryseobacterium limigenitum]SFZ91578.1 hypothetical protein SAMN05216324_102418 [Chryseobacterium limigenitum]